MDANLNRNVTDYYKSWETEAIKDDLGSKRVPMVNVCMNLTNDFNKANVIRTNNAYLGSAVYMVGRRRYDKRGTVGTHHYENVHHTEYFKDVATTLKSQGYTLYAVDNIESHGPSSVWDVKLPEKTAFVYGEELLGLSEDIISECDGMLYIPMYGSVRSLNVGTAAAIMMNEYARQNRALYEGEVS